MYGIKKVNWSAVDVNDVYEVKYAIQEAKEEYDYDEERNSFDYWWSLYDEVEELEEDWA